MEMTSMNISLPEAMKEYIEAKVAAGGYGTVSEYIRELVRAAQKREAEEKLEALLLEGINSGEPIEVTPDFWEDLRRDLRRRLAKSDAA
jgi:antitoxin ParD1/3/4